MTQNYLVFICGHEGIERIFGPFTGKAAHVFAKRLRRRLPGAWAARVAHEAAIDEFRQAHGGEWPSPEEVSVPDDATLDLGYVKPEQVCIQVSGPGHRYSCACPKFGFSKGLWLY